MYLVGQFLALQRAQTPDWELHGLERLIEELHALNIAFCKRLNSIPIRDASINALVVLATLSDFTDQLLPHSDLTRLEQLFAPHAPRA
jgi:hypothetical protein